MGMGVNKVQGVSEKCNYQAVRTLGSMKKKVKCVVKTTNENLDFLDINPRRLY